MVVPVHLLPRGPWPAVGRCPVCQHLHCRYAATGTMSTHTTGRARAPQDTSLQCGSKSYLAMGMSLGIGVLPDSGMSAGPSMPPDM